MSIVSGSLIQALISQSAYADLSQMSIREVGKLVTQLEQKSGVEFLHMEIGSPGLPPVPVAVSAEITALKSGVASKYPNIEGVTILKSEMARFAKFFMDIEVTETCCVPTVGAMQASFAALLASARTHVDRPYTLFLDPGFPVQKQQLQLMGLPYKSFDFKDYRGEKLREKIEEFLRNGDICSISYSSPNNPTWVCFTNEELKIIGELASKYDVIVIEDLAYFGMDFRQFYGVAGVPPFQPTVAKYTSNYILLLSASKIFSYAGQRVGMLIISETLYHRKFSNLKSFYSNDIFGQFISYGILYATTAGTSHSAQLAMAHVLKACNENEYDFVTALHPYGFKAQLIKALFIKYGFYIVYNDYSNELADGFYFSLAYPGLTSAKLLMLLLCCGISATSLAIAGSENEAAIRACVSFIKIEQMGELEKRIIAFKELVNQNQ